MNMVSEFQMTEDDRTATHGAMRPDRGTAGHTDATGQGSVFSDPDIVADLNQVIKFDAILNHSVFNGAAVNASVGTDFHLVSDDHTAELLDLYPFTLVKGEAETVCAYHHPGMKNAIFTHDTFVGNGDPGFKP